MKLKYDGPLSNCSFNCKLRHYATGTIAFDWSLCCGDDWLLAVVNSSYFVGALVGASAGGVLSDLFGAALHVQLDPGFAQLTPRLLLGTFSA